MVSVASWGVLEVSLLVTCQVQNLAWRSPMNRRFYWSGGRALASMKSYVSLPPTAGKTSGPKALAARRDRKTPRIAGMGPIPSPVGWLGASKISSLTWWRVTWPIPIAFQTRGSPMVSELRLATRGQSFPSLETRPVSCTFVRYSDPDVLSWEDLLS